MTRRSTSNTIAISANSAWNLVNYRSGLLKNLIQQGFRVVALTPEDNSVSRLSSLGIEWRKLEIQSDGTNPVTDGLLLWRYIRELRDLHPVVYLGVTSKPNIYGCLAAGLLGIPAIANVSGLGTAFVKGGVLEAVVNRLYKLGFRRTERVFFQNSEDRQLFLARGLVREEQAGLLPGSGVNLAHFQASRETAADAPECRFLFAARLIAAKGIHHYVEAARIVHAERPECRFAILGPLEVANRTAIGKAELDALVRDGIVEYRGEATDVRPHIDWADALVLPSHYREGVPRILLEGSAMARPLLATDVPGSRELVVDGMNGFLCAPRSTEALADAMRRFVTLTVAKKQEMGRNARAHVEQFFDEKIVIARYANAIAELRGASVSSSGR